MTNTNKDIRDDEFRIIGPHSPTHDNGRSRRNRTAALVLAGTVILLALLAVIFWPGETAEDPNDGLFENLPDTEVSTLLTPLGTTPERACTERIDTVVNGMQIALYLPHNATPELVVGIPDHNDSRIILSAQAADIRRDNRKILGAFVLNGKPLAWGLSKKGFCAIIDGNVTIGYSENSPLFEESIEKGGYFFRQFPLVDNGRLIENDQPIRTMRKALCSRAGQIFVAVSETDATMNDFAQALVELGVENAIYLVGSHSAFGWYLDGAGEKTLFAPDVHRGTYKNENYIVWRKK
ncbi:MAG: phosphodiester glycosidase family protein [Bacteroidales bacterium]|nr:phosphodiester glycosidase family protein [Bacteroidales bacterium]